MKQYRIALLRKEFPFVDRLFVAYDDRVLLPPEKVNDIKIQKGDKALLVKTGSEDSYSWGGGGHHDYTKYFAIWSENEEQKILELESSGYSGTGSGERHEWSADTIGEQLFVKGITPDYIIECVKNDTDDNGNGEVRYFWTIFKMKRFDLFAYHQGKIDEAAAALKAEIALVCAQA